MLLKNEVQKLSTLVLGFLTLFLVACSPKTPETSSAKSKVIRVLAYSSFLGKDSLGAWLKAEFEKSHPGNEIVFVEARDEAGIAGEIKRANTGNDKVDVVVGLDPVSLDKVGKDLFASTFEISSSPMTILIDKSRAPKALLATNLHFKTWQEVLKSKLLQKAVLIQDPRFSAPGLSWLLQAHSGLNVSPKDYHSLVNRVLPSWSASFKAFENQSFAIWTYSSSLSYYECENKKHHYAQLVVDEGYVSSVEIAGSLKSSPNQVEATEVLAFMRSDEFQKKMVELNWVYPISETTELPKCYLPKTQFQTLSSPQVPSAKDVSGWIDEWQLF